MGRDNPEKERWRQTFRAMLQEAPTDYVGRYRQYVTMHDAFHAELMSELGSPMREYLTSQPQDTQQERIALADQLNKQLHRINLSLFCSWTGKEAKLAVSPQKDSTSGKYPFVLEVEGEDGKPPPKPRRVPRLEQLTLAAVEPSMPSAAPSRSEKAPSRPKGR